MIGRVTRFVTDRFIRSRHLNATRLVAAFFGVFILLGTLLLALPISSRTGESVGLLPALFTATSAHCVTGLIVADTCTTWSVFGQVVLLLLIQLGGLGFMTVITLVSLAAHRRIGLSQRLLMVSTLNLSDLDGVVQVVKLALKGTLLLELGGAAVLSIRMIPRFGVVKGLWHALFHSVSAFCNAGFDLQGMDTGAFSSLTGYDGDPLVLLTTAALVIIGGLGFFVWQDILCARRWKRLTLYTRLVLSLTLALLAGGTVFFFLTEGSNPATLGDMPLWQKWLNAFFQSATLRTAGFNAIDQGAMRDASVFVSCILMLIGGSSGSTAGGMKTVTVWTLVMVALTSLRGREHITVRGRTLPARRAMDAVTLFLVVVMLWMGGSVLLTVTGQLPFLSAAYEIASALGTVGLTTGITPGLSPLTHAALIALMYIGRVGVLSMSIAFLTGKRSGQSIRYPEFNVMIG